MDEFSQQEHFNSNSGTEADVHFVVQEFLRKKPRLEKRFVWEGVKEAVPRGIYEKLPKEGKIEFVGGKGGGRGRTSEEGHDELCIENTLIGRRIKLLGA